MRLSGVVQDEHGHPVDQVVVLFVSAPTEVPDIAALTNGAGEFELTAHREGLYRLGFRAPRYQLQEIEIDVHDNVDVTVTLRPRQARSEDPSA